MFLAPWSRGRLEPIGKKSGADKKLASSSAQNVEIHNKYSWSTFVPETLVDETLVVDLLEDPPDGLHVPSQ